MRLEAPLHALSQALAIRALRFAQSHAMLPWTTSERRALDLCEESFNVCSALQKSQVQLQNEGCMRAMRKLRVAQPLPEGICPENISKRLFINSPSHATMMDMCPDILSEQRVDNSSPFLP